MTTSTPERPEFDTSSPRLFVRCRPALIWLVLIALLLLAWAYPIRNGAIRNLILLDLVAIWFGVAIVWRRRPVGLAVLAIMGVSAGAIVFLPGRKVDDVALRDRYVATLRSYEGVKYVWGGENHRGVDCSGLVRCALAEAEFREGIQTRNPRLLREAFKLWRQDASAMTLRDGFSNRARRVGEVIKLNTAPAHILEPGDFAVTPGGGHTLAYLGQNTWIAADPSLRIVKTYQSPDPREFWLRTRLIILRWRVLEQ